MYQLTADEYLQSMLAKYYVSTNSGSQGYQTAQKIIPYLKEWSDSCLNEIKFSGSYAKGTAVRGSADIDLFISLIPNTDGSLQELYENLNRFLFSKGFHPQKQNVSIKINENGMNVDIIPAKKREGNTNYHSVWMNRQNTWTQTNIDLHINHVSQSGRLDEIKLTKIWRNLNNLDFPSFYLELIVLRALNGAYRSQLAKNFYSVLEFLQNYLVNTRIEDPSNSNNIISDDLSTSAKQIIVNAASTSLRNQYWEQTIW